jgi:hypothetical protein
MLKLLSFRAHLQGLAHISRCNVRALSVDQRHACPPDVLLLQRSLQHLNRLMALESMTCLDFLLFNVML